MNTAPTSPRHAARLNRHAVTFMGPLVSLLLLPALSGCAAEPAGTTPQQTTAAPPTPPPDNPVTRQQLRELQQQRQRTY